ncbi:hypothetical protein [Wolbachia endosymbiont (group A) of Agelastica alni]
MYAIAILRFIPQLYEDLFLLNTTKMSSQSGIQESLLVSKQTSIEKRFR